MSFAGGLLRGALLHTRSTGLLFPGASAATASSRGCLRPFTSSRPMNSDENKLTEKEENRLAIIGAVQEDITPLSMVPQLHIQHRRVRIFKVSKNAMQSGTNATQKWRMEWDAWERWENPLMGWTSTGDPLSNTIVEFSDLEDAIAYCEKNRWNYEIEHPQKLRRLKKSYGANYSWNKRTRTSAK